MCSVCVAAAATARCVGGVGVIISDEVDASISQTGPTDLRVVGGGGAGFSSVNSGDEFCRLTAMCARALALPPPATACDDSRGRLT